MANQAPSFSPTHLPPNSCCPDGIVDGDGVDGGLGMESAEAVDGSVDICDGESGGMESDEGVDSEDGGNSKGDAVHGDASADTM